MQTIQAKTTLPFERIVATPTLHSWSQTYSAGTLFAVLSLTTDENEPVEEIHLHSIGKTVFQNLEAEYFTLEKKDLTSIKQAVISSYEQVPQTVTISLVVAVVIEKILYVVAVGGGKTLLKRINRIGTILEATPDKEPKASSGFVEDSDTILLETSAFREAISDEEATNAMLQNTVTDAAEALTLSLHQKAADGATALLFMYQKQAETPEETIAPVDTAIREEVSENISEETIAPPHGKQEQSSRQKISFKMPKIILPRIAIPFTKRTILFGVIAVALIAALTGGIYASVQAKENAANQAIFASFYADAQKQYDEGTSLLGLNKNLARADLHRTQELLNANIPKLKKNSIEYKKANDLLVLTNNALTTLSDEQSLVAVSSKNTALALSFYKTPAVQYTTQEDTNEYAADDSGITLTTPSKTTQIIKKDWKSIGGLSAYTGNVYVLDKSADQIFKFSQGSYTKSNYFTASTPDLSNAISIAIDGSVYILFTNGDIAKFTKGVSETFSLKGLETPLASASRLFTTTDIPNLYVLDNGNARIVVFSKDGQYVSQYKADVLKDAKDLFVNEAEKTIFVYSQNQVFELHF